MRQFRLIEILTSEKQIEKQGNHFTCQKTKAKSSLHSPQNRNACLEKTNDFSEQQTFQTSSKNKSHLNKTEKKNLSALKNSSELIIKEVNKGGCVVLMNKPHEKNKNYQQLNEVINYQKPNQKSYTLVSVKN